jgi:hypothetical protein
MKHTIELKLYLSEIVYDIQQRAFLIGESLRKTGNADTDESAAMVQDINDERKDAVLRSIGTTWATIRDVCYEYLKGTNHTADNLLLPETRKKVATALSFSFQGSNPSADNTDETEDNTLQMMLRMPTNSALASSDALAADAHTAIVCNALAEWLLLTPARDLAATYVQSAASALQAMNTALNRRVRPNRLHAPSAEAPHTNDMRYE